MNYRRIVPNSISSLSLIFGIMSIFKSMEGDFFWAPILIVLAVLADSCDGRAARMLGVSGPFGAELDSLCDLGSFGVAPAVMIYCYSLHELGTVGQFIAALFAIGGAMRLARFNININSVKGYFQGMPVPGAACCLAAYVFSKGALNVWLVAAMTVAYAMIMYSEIKYPDFKGKGNPLYKLPVCVAVVIGAAMLYMMPSAWMFVALFTYTLIGVINWIYCLLTGK